MKINDIERWRVEIELAEKYRKEHFGVYDEKEHTRAGENIDYFERGFSTHAQMDVDMITTLNLTHAITKNVVPSLYFQNPKVMVLPKKIESQGTSTTVSQILNYYFKELGMEEINQKIIWDAYVLGHGYYKVGYTTKFGMDIKDETKKKKSRVDKALEAVGLKPKDKEEITRPEIDLRIISERPYVKYISPFNFGRDPRANTLEESMYWYESFRKSVKQMKKNKKYKNTKDLKGQIPEGVHIGTKVTETEIEDFKTVDVFEIHYRNEDKVYDLVISKDSEEYEEHYHEESVYDIDGWQCGELSFNKHGHQSYAISDITKIRNLQDRFTATIDAILEQVDRMVPKVAYNGNDITPDGKLALRDGDIGALVECTKNPREVIQEIGMTQLKADLRALNEEIINIVTVQTGITRAQLTGVSGYDTATEATIAQGGQTLRISDMTQNVHRFTRKQVELLWQVIKQFVDLEELELVNGVIGVDEQSGLPKYSWLTVTPEQSEKMQIGQYDFDIEVGSTQKPDLIQVRKQFENLFSLLARTDVIMMMQQQGDKIVLSELLRMYINLFPEAVKDVGRVIQKIVPGQTQGLIPPEQEEQRGGNTAGSNFNAVERQAAQPAPGAF